MANVTVKCVDAFTGEILSGASFKLLHKPHGKRNYEEVEFIENCDSCFLVDDLKNGKYFLEEVKAPSWSVQVEDENCNLLVKTQTYALSGKTPFIVDKDKDAEVVVEHLPAGTPKLEVKEPTKLAALSSSNTRHFLLNKWLSLYDCSHELNSKEFEKLVRQISCVCVVVFFALLLLFLPLLSLGIIATIVFIVGLLTLIGIAGFMEIKNFSTPRNRVLDKIPKPIRTGPNVGIYGTNEIVNDPKLVKKILSSTNKLNEIEIGDPGVYCGYYQCSTSERLWNILADHMNKNGKHHLHKYSGYYVYIPDDCHVIIYGDTRAGKTRRVLLSTIHLISRGKNESFIIFDSKREILALTSEKLREEGYDIKVYDFEHPENSTRHNPLYVAIDYVKQGKLNEASQEVAERVNALVEPGVMVGQNKFFYEGAINLIKAVTMAILCDEECPDDQKTFTTVSRMLEQQVTKRPVDPKRPLGLKYSPFEEYIEVKYAIDHPANNLYALLKETEEKYISNFISTAQQLMSVFRDASIADMTRVTENPFKNIAKRKQAVFIVAPSSSQAYKTLATMFLDQMYCEIRGEAGEDTVVNGVHQVGRTTRRVNFICEEILSINPWAKLMDALNEGAGLGMRFFLVIQNQQLFNQKYGREEAEGIKPNCATQMLITTGDTKETVSHWKTQLGTMTVANVSKNISGTRWSPIKSNVTISHSACKRDCLTEAEIQGWDANCGLLIKTKLHENVLNVPLPDVSCTPTEDYFKLGSKQDNLEKAFKILKENFKGENFDKSKTDWLPGIPDAYDVKYNDQQIRKLLDARNKLYKDAFLKKQENNDAESTGNKLAVVYNEKTGHVHTYNNLKDLEKDLNQLKYSNKEGWKLKKFKNYREKNEFVRNFKLTFANKNVGSQSTQLFN